MKEIILKRAEIVQMEIKALTEDHAKLTTIIKEVEQKIIMAQGKMQELQAMMDSLTQMELEAQKAEAEAAIAQIEKLNETPVEVLEEPIEEEIEEHNMVEEEIVHLSATEEIEVSPIVVPKTLKK